MDRHRIVSRWKGRGEDEVISFFSTFFLYHFYILFSLFCHTITISFFEYKYTTKKMKKKNQKKNINKVFSLPYERDVRQRIISQCSTIYCWWMECFWRQKDGCSSFFLLLLRAFYISTMFSTKTKKRKKKKKESSFFFTHTTHVFWVFRSLLTTHALILLFSVFFF